MTPFNYAKFPPFLREALPLRPLHSPPYFNQSSSDVEYPSGPKRCGDCFFLVRLTPPSPCLSGNPLLKGFGFFVSEARRPLFQGTPCDRLRQALFFCFKCPDAPHRLPPPLEALGLVFFFVNLPGSFSTRHSRCGSSIAWGSSLLVALVKPRPSERPSMHCQRLFRSALFLQGSSGPSRPPITSFRA